MFSEIHEAFSDSACVHLFAVGHELCPIRVPTRKSISLITAASQHGPGAGRAPREALSLWPCGYERCRAGRDDVAGRVHTYQTLITGLISSREGGVLRIAGEGKMPSRKSVASLDEPHLDSWTPMKLSDSNSLSEIPRMHPTNHWLWVDYPERWRICLLQYSRTAFVCQRMILQQNQLQRTGTNMDGVFSRDN